MSELGISSVEFLKIPTLTNSSKILGKPSFKLFLLPAAEDCLNNSFQKLLKQKNTRAVAFSAFEFIESDPVSLLGAEEFGDFAGDCEIRLILSLQVACLLLKTRYNKIHKRITRN